MRNVEEELRAGLRRLVATAPATAPATVYDRVVRRHRRRVAAARYGTGVAIVAVLAATAVIPGTLSPLDPAPDTSRGPTPSTAKRGYLEPIVWVPASPPVGCRGPEPSSTQCHRSSSFTVTPNSGPPGTRVTIAGGGCARSARGRTIALALESESGGGTHWEDLPVRPDGTYRFSITVPRALVAQRYMISLDCSGPGVVEGYRTFTAVDPGPGRGRGRPDGGGFVATAEPVAKGEPPVRLSGTGCFLPQSGGMPGGIVTMVVTKPDQPFTGYTPEFGDGFGLYWVKPNGTWEVRNAITIPGHGTRDIHAFCLDSMHHPGFKYARVYRLEGGRLTDVTP
jgi:hypothetical protein